MKLVNKALGKVGEESNPGSPASTMYPGDTSPGAPADADTTDEENIEFEVTAKNTFIAVTDPTLKERVEENRKAQRKRSCPPSPMSRSGSEMAPPRPPTCAPDSRTTAAASTSGHQDSIDIA